MKLSVVAIVFLCLALTISEALKLKTFTRQYGPFNKSYESIFEVVDHASIYSAGGALQLTPDSGGDLNLQHKSGRVLLKRKFKLWDRDTNSANGSLASFNSSFLINMFRKTSIPGEGLTFLIAPDLKLPPGSSDEYLGLTNSTTDGNSTNQIVAIELDTFKQDFDPDSNHIGLDINSVRSIKAESLTPHGIELSPVDAKYYNVWVQYDGINKSIEVYIAEQPTKEGPTPPRPETPVLKSDLNLRGLVNQYSYFGFSGSTGNLTQLNCVLRWNLTVQHYQDKNTALKIGLAAGIPSLVVALLAAAGLGYYLRKKQRVRFDPRLGALNSLPGTPREFRFKDLKKATDNFAAKNKLGQGGYGVVYKGLLPKEDLQVAVKKFSRDSIKGTDDFLAELTIINRLRHRHLVPLLGWCHKNGKLLLVYDYMPKGSLDKHLFGGPDSRPLSWDLRYKIVSGVASALHYLHDEYDQTVVHRDLKASNIMLDSNFNTRLGDFGLARALDNEKTSYATEAEGVHGTLGYIAPECFLTGKATQQSDTYAFGAVVMEVVCGRRPGANIGKFQFLVDWVWSLYQEGDIQDAVDERLGEEFVTEEADRLLLLGLACSHPIASERPKTRTIAQIISGTVPVPYVPPFKPAFVWPSMPIGEEDITDIPKGDTMSITTTHLGSEWTPQYLSSETYARDTSANSLE